MNVTLNIFIRKDGEVYREELNCGTVTKAELENRLELKSRFQHGDSPFENTKDNCTCWYTLSLEDHEREAI